MAGRDNKHKRKARQGDPPTSHSEASLLNQRNPEGSVSNPPQLNDPDAPPPPQRPRASLRSSETANPYIVTRKRSDAGLPIRTVGIPVGPPSPPRPLRIPGRPERNTPECAVCGSSLYAFRSQLYDVIICNACNGFYKRLPKYLQKKKTLPRCEGNNNCTDFRGNIPCKSCRYEKCQSVGMHAVDRIPTPPVPEPQAPDFIHAPIAPTTRQRLRERVQRSQGGNRVPREAPIAAVPQPSRPIAPSQPSAMPSRSGVPPISFNPLLSVIFVWAKKILDEARLNEPQMRQIFRTQWPMLLALTCFENTNHANAVDAFYTELKPQFQKWQVLPREFEHLKKIALFMRPIVSFEYRFQKQRNDQYDALRTLCGNQARFRNLLKLLSTIRDSTTDIPISEEELAAIIDTILR